jgi:homoserine O-acetyltransferase
MKAMARGLSLACAALLMASAALAQGQAGESTTWPAPREGDYVVHNFHFRSGETMAEVRLHYRTLGTPRKDSSGRTSNAVLILHGTTGNGQLFLRPFFAGVLFGPGQLLDARKYFIILPDNIGHGKSSRPSDGMRMRFPKYEYSDMVELQHELLEKGLGVSHLRLVMGTSMGCMHSWMWGEAYPNMMDALMPLACLPVQIAGRNRIWREMLMDAIRQDPKWNHGNYTSEPIEALQTVADLMIVAGSAPVYLRHDFPTRDAADRYLVNESKRLLKGMDANDVLYAFNSSRNYDPSTKLGEINVPVMYINSADDFINPPELGIAEKEIKKVKRGKFVLLPISPETRGHSTHTRAAVWQKYLKELLQESQS